MKADGLTVSIFRINGPHQFRYLTAHPRRFPDGQFLHEAGKMRTRAHPLTILREQVFGQVKSRFDVPFKIQVVEDIGFGQRQFSGVQRQLTQSGRMLND